MSEWNTAAETYFELISSLFSFCNSWQKNVTALWENITKIEEVISTYIIESCSYFRVSPADFTVYHNVWLLSCLVYSLLGAPHTY